MGCGRESFEGGGTEECNISLVVPPSSVPFLRPFCVFLRSFSLFTSSTCLTGLRSQRGSWRIFATVKVPSDGTTVPQQETLLLETCAELIAKKFLELLSLGKDGMQKADLPTFSTSTALMLTVKQKWDDLEVRGSSGNKPQGSVVTEGLTPKVILQDADGRPLTEHETVVLGKGKAQTVRHIPWRVWAEKSCTMDEDAVAKKLLELAQASLHHHLTCAMPISMTSQGNVVKALAVDAIPIGGLKVPLWFKKEASMVMEGSAATKHPKAVVAEVSWVLPVTPAEEEAGVEVGHTVTKKIHVQPELKLPRFAQEDFLWTPTDSVHPFWFIKRDDEGKGEANASMVMEKVTHVSASDFIMLKQANVRVNACVVTYKVMLPCIVNTTALEAGQEVVVKWQPRTTQKKQKAAVEKTAFDLIARGVKKAKKDK